jgi:cellulose synthase operon protein C
MSARVLSLLLVSVIGCFGARTAAAQSAEADLRALRTRIPQLGPADSLIARVRQGLTAYEAGRRDEAYRIFDTFIDSYNNANGRLTSNELYAVGIAMRYLGDRDPELFRDAIKAFDEAIARDHTNYAANVAVGMMFLDKYNAPEAAKAFEAVLRTNPRYADALLGKAMALDFSGDQGSVEAARQALAADPQHTGAHLFLTRAFWQSDDLDSARVHAAEAMRSNPASTDALIAAALVAQAEGNTTALTAIRARVAGNTTAASRIDVALAEMSVQQRQYASAVKLARSAIASDSGYWRGWSVLGINQLRLGEIAAARASLEKSFKGDPYNVWVKNTLDLLDRLDEFESRTGSRFVVVASRKDAGVLAPYVEALGNEAYAKLEERYGYEPPVPVRLELFDRHADFSVRTVGLAGLGALGVSFGSVLAMDAPSAREPGQFNWGATFWHELAHAFHLGMTSHRVPRWFTEGLAVLEERKARAGWGEEGLPLFVRAARENRLLPLADLNSGFSRPTYPQQVGVSYYQASLILEMIEQKHGVAAIRGMLKAYADGKSTDTVLREVLRTTAADIDREFAPFVQQRINDEARQATANAANDVAMLKKNGTIQALENAMYIFPYDVDTHEKLAALYAARNQWRDVVRERNVILALEPVDMPEARYQLAYAHYMAGDAAAARTHVLRALEAAPSFARAQDLLLKLEEKPQ